jgi:hypothetical protein
MPDLAETPDVQLIKISHNAFGRVNTSINLVVLPFPVGAASVGLAQPSAMLELKPTVR